MYFWGKQVSTLSHLYVKHLLPIHGLMKFLDRMKMMVMIQSNFSQLFHGAMGRLACVGTPGLRYLK